MSGSLLIYDISQITKSIAIGFEYDYKPPYTSSNMLESLIV